MTIALRFGLFLNLMLLFGVTCYALSFGRQLSSRRRRTALRLLGLAALFLSMTAFVVSAAGMAGVSPGEIDRATLLMIMTETSPGTAFLCRTAALSVAILLAVAASARILAAGITIASAVALITLEWGGHAAVTEGVAGTVHRLADGVHLLAAAGWLGALVMLLRALARLPGDGLALTEARHALKGFASSGSVLVATVLLSGLINGWLILGWAGIQTLPYTLYGQLLLIKLSLFGGMLGLAAVNRWRLTPRLAAAEQSGNQAAAVRALRISIGLETAAAIVILALVAWLGTLAPPPMT